MFCGLCSSSPSLVAFWDEGSRQLSLQPRSSLDRESSSICLPKLVLISLVPQYHRLKAPRFKSTFDLYNPNGSQAFPLARTPIIPQDVADTEGRTFEATLHFNRLGIKSKLLRAVSKQHRVLYVGSLSNIEEKVWPVYIDKESGVIVYLEQFFILPLKGIWGWFNEISSVKGKT